MEKALPTADVPLIHTGLPWVDNLLGGIATGRLQSFEFYDDPHGVHEALVEALRRIGLKDTLTTVESTEMEPSSPDVPPGTRVMLIHGRPGRILAFNAYRRVSIRGLIVKIVKDAISPRQGFIGTIDGSDWWTHHLQTCGTSFRGCDPECPKDRTEREEEPDA